MRDGEPLGWTTDLLVAFDGLAPGLIRRLMVSAPMVRQAIFLTLAEWDSFPATGPDAPARDVAESLAEVLRSGWAKEIIAHQFGTVPDGLLPALERIGPAPMNLPQSYSRLWEMFTDGDQRKAAALRDVQEITARTIRILDALDPLLVHPATLQRVDSVPQAVDLNRAVRFIQAACSTATDEAISAAIAQMRSADGLPRLIDRFVRRADRFPHQPVAGDHELRPLATARAMTQAGREYRNCLASMIGEALVGRVAFAEFVGTTGKAVCEFRPLSGDRGWLLVDVHTLRNGLAPRDLRSAAEQKCAAVGIPHIASPDAGDWRSVRRAIRHHDALGLLA